jgi:flagellar protein FlaG
MDAIKNVSTNFQASDLSYISNTIDRINAADSTDTSSLHKMEKELNNIAASMNFELDFHIHKKTGRIFVKVLDKHSHKVIKEIPPENILDFLSKFEETLGKIFDKRT